MSDEIFQYRHAGSNGGRAGFFSPVVGLMAGMSLLTPAVFPSIARALLDSPRKWVVLFALCSMVTGLLGAIGLSSGIWNARRHGWGCVGNTIGVALNALVLLVLLGVVAHNVATWNLH